MGFIATDQADDTIPADEPAAESADPQLPDAEEVLDYLVEHSDKTRDELEQRAAELQEKYRQLEPRSAYYLIGDNELDLDPAEAFGTKDHDTALEITNIVPEMPVTLEATVDKAPIADPEEKDWARQDVWLSDDTGMIKLVLWNEDIISSLSSGDELKLVGCWSDTFNGSTQIKLGRNGNVYRREDDGWNCLTNAED